MIQNDPVATTDLPVHLYSASGRSGVFNTFKKIVREFPVAHALGFRFAERNIRASIVKVYWAYCRHLFLLWQRLLSGSF